MSTIILAQRPEGDMENDNRRKLECVSRGWLQGLATGSITFATMYLGQRFFTKRMKGVKWSTMVGSSAMFAAVATYLIIDAKTKECEKLFKSKQTTANASSSDKATQATV